MTSRPEAEVFEESVEPLLEELLAEIMTGARPESKSHEGESLTATLAEVAVTSFSRAVSQASAVERVLLVEALAPTLAEALAPALAKALAPEIVTALSHLAEAAESTEAEFESGYDESESGYDDFEPAEGYAESPGVESGSQPDEGGSGNGKSKGKRSRE